MRSLKSHARSWRSSALLRWANCSMRKQTRTSIVAFAFRRRMAQQLDVDDVKFLSGSDQLRPFADRLHVDQFRCDVSGCFTDKASPGWDSVLHGFRRLLVYACPA